ncbi:hypothetical protein DPMN_129422 [Dreissena polymorpha]|uniref:Transmembrane protein n=1 Tax=Dreissena polymorpha TaxID=45954 RepID=A0A9D4H353_DREPO|nr:hypothetical protein DPMN_129422 [Dreissena polymorpha]
MFTRVQVRFEVRIPIKLTADQWIRTLEQLLLLVLILCRWLLPRGRLSHDQLSQLLLVYIGTAADIVEFFEAFKEKEVTSLASRVFRLLCFLTSFACLRSFCLMTCLACLWCILIDDLLRVLTVFLFDDLLHVLTVFFV